MPPNADQLKRQIRNYLFAYSSILSVAILISSKQDLYHAGLALLMLFNAGFMLFFAWRVIENWVPLAVQSSSPGVAPIQERLNILEGLLAANAITPNEHADRRAQILASI
jgi:hypothetical protein